MAAEVARVTPSKTAAILGWLTMLEETRRKACQLESFERSHQETEDSRLLESETVGELGLLLRSEESRETVGEDGGDGDISEGDSVSNEEGVGGEVSLEDGEDTGGLLDSVLENLRGERRKGGRGQLEEEEEEARAQFERKADTNGLDVRDVVVEHSVGNSESLGDLER